MNGSSLNQSEKRIIGNGTRIFLLYEQYPHILKFVSEKSGSFCENCQDEVEEKSMIASNDPSVSVDESSVAVIPKKNKIIKRTVKEYFGAKSDVENKDFVSSRKRAKVENSISSSDESEEEEKRVQEVAEKLSEMRRSMTKDRIVSASGMKRSASLPLQQVTNGLSKFGFPKVPGDEWEKFGSLTVYTCKGSIPREKVIKPSLNFELIMSGWCLSLSASCRNC